MIAQQEQAIENLLFKQEQQDTPFNLSIEPSIKEIERFLIYLNKRFSCGVDFKDITILISTAKPTTAAN